MNHIYIGLGDAAKEALGDFYQLYRSSTVDKSSSLHAEFLTVTDVEQQKLYLFDNLPENTVEVNYQIQSITVEPPTIRDALMFLRDHRWLKMDAEEQVFWASLIDANSEDIEKLPRRVIRLNLAATLEKLLNQIHAAYLRLQSKYDDEGLALHLLVDVSNEWVKAILSDVVVQLRQHYPSLFCRLSVFVLLPPNFSVTKMEPTESASLYATFVELNALLNNHWLPENLLNILPLSEDGNWVNACYLVERDNEQYDVSGLSALLLRKSFVKDTVWQGLFSDEYAHYENGQRVKKPNFVSFGMLRLSVTVDYPTEYYKKLFTVQVLNALLFANWQEGIGFIADDNYETRQEFVSQLDYMMREWCLDSDYLRLNKLMTNDQSKLHPKWASVEMEWERNREERLDSLSDVSSSERSDVLLKKYQDFYQDRFRLKGVDNFYELEWTESRLDALAFKLVSNIEKSLIAQWWNYERGLADLPAMVLSVMDYLEHQSKALEEEREEHEQKEAKHMAQYQRLATEKADNKTLFRLFGTDRNELGELDDQLYAVFTARTHIQSLLFARRLFERLYDKLDQLHDQISEIFNHLVTVRDRYAKILQQIDQISAKGTWVSHQRDTHIQQVSLNVYLEIEKMRDQIFAQPFEIKSFVKKFKSQLRDQFSQHANFNIFNEHLGQKEFGMSLDKISDGYAEHLDFLLSGKNKRPETSELITAAVNLTPQRKMNQFTEFLEKVVSIKQPHSYVPSLTPHLVHVFDQDSKFFAPEWVKDTNSQPVLDQLLKAGQLTMADVKPAQSLSNYLDLISVYHLNVKTWPAMTHLASMYQNSLSEYDNIKRAFFQLHSEHRLVSWMEHALIDPEYSAEAIRRILIKAYALNIIDFEVDGFKVMLTNKESGQVLTTDGWVSLVTLLDNIKLADIALLERVLQTSDVAKNLNVSFQSKLEQLLYQLKQAFFALDDDDDDEDDGEWAVAGMFVAWQRSTQKVLNELS